MILKKMLLTEKVGDHLKSNYKTKLFWNEIDNIVDGYYNDYHSKCYYNDYDYEYYGYWETGCYYCETFSEMIYISEICDEGNIFEAIKEEEKEDKKGISFRDGRKKGKIYYCRW